MLLEIACFNFESALIAQKAGAHRIELCENYKEGGISPSPELIRKTRKELSVPMYIMVRPRSGDFVYTSQEFQVMKMQIMYCREQKCDGLVFGILTKKNVIDISRCKELIELAKPLPCTFHRAFDELENQEEGLEQLIQLGFSRVLTSGKAKTALEGSQTLAGLIKLGGKRITIIAGGGIRSANATEIQKLTSVSEIHSAAIPDHGEIAGEDEIRSILRSF